MSNRSKRLSPKPITCRACGQSTTAGRLRNHGKECVQCYVPPKPQPSSRFGYWHPVRRFARFVLRLKCCPCGCSTVYVRDDARYFGDLTRLQKWATFDPDEVS